MGFVGEQVAEAGLRQGGVGTQGRAERRARQRLCPRDGLCSYHIMCPVRGCQMACAHVMMLVNLFDKTVVLLKDSPAVRCEVGVRIECSCPQRTTGELYPYRQR